MRKTLVILFILFLIFLCCGEGPGPSQPTDEPSTMRIEYEYQAPKNAWYDIFSRFRRLESITASNFKLAGTNLYGWQDTLTPFEVNEDHYYFTEDSLLREFRLDDFWNNFKTSDQEYYLASVKGLDSNVGQTDKTLGATYKNVFYEPNVPPDHKWSFVFVDDMPIEFYEGNYTKERFVTYTVIHELGHQRAGLTHPEEYSEYHNSANCIMYTMKDKTDDEISDILDEMEFCWSADTSDTNSCRYWLKKQNQ